MNRHRMPRERRSVPWVGIGVGVVIAASALVVGLVAPQARATQRLTSPAITTPAIVPGPLAPMPQPQPEPAALTTSDAPAPEREAFLHYLDQAGIDMSGKKDFAIDLGQLAAQSHAGDPQLKQVVHILFPQLNDQQVGSFVDSVHIAFPDQG